MVLGRHCRDFEARAFEQWDLDNIGNGLRDVNHIPVMSKSRECEHSGLACLMLRV